MIDPKALVRRAYAAGARLYLGPVLRRESSEPLYDAIGEQGFDWEFSLRAVNECAPPRILDVGTGLAAWPHVLASCGYDVTAIDRVDGYWRDGLFNRHFLVRPDDITQPRVEGPFDLVNCTSALQHVDDPDAAMREMFRLTRPGGHIVLTFPYNEQSYVEDVYALPESRYGKEFGFPCHVFSRVQLDGWLAENGGELVRQEYLEVFTGHLWTLGERIAPPRRTSVDRPHHRAAVLLRKR